MCLLHCNHLYSCERITQTIYTPSKNTEDLTMKQMFDISEKLISEQSDEIYGVNTINWEYSSWKYLFLVGDEQVVSLLHGSIEFWRLKDYLRNHFVQSQHWSDEKWKSTMSKGGGNKKRFQYCTDLSGQEILYLRALQGHSGRNFIDPSLQDNVLIPNDFFQYIYHIGCAINLHSTMNLGLILGRTNFERKTDGILHVCGFYEQRTQRSGDN